MTELTVVIPFRNAERVLLRCAESVFSLPCSFEVLLWDRGATDTTSILCQSYTGEERVRYFREKEGKEISWDTLLKISRGQYITFVGAEDGLLSEGIRRQLQFAEERELDLCAGKVVRGRKQRERERYGESFLAGYCPEHSKMLLERIHWEQTEGKLYRKTFLSSLARTNLLPSCFEENIRFNLTVAEKAERVGYVPLPCYKKGKKKWDFSEETIFI